MSIETSLATWLATNITLATGGIHALRLPQDPVLPALVYLRVSTVRDYSHSGDSNFTECRFQFSCWADTYAECRQLAAQVENLLGGYHGVMGDVYIGHCLAVGDQDIYQPATKQFHAPLDFMIAFNE